MLEFVKGRFDRLEGRGVIYTRGTAIRIGDYNETIPFYSVFMGSTPGDAFDVAASHGIQMPTDVRTELDAVFRKRLESNRKAYAEYCDGIESSLQEAMNSIPDDARDEVETFIKDMLFPKQNSKKVPLQVSSIHLPLNKPPSSSGASGDVIRVVDFPGNAFEAMRYIDGFANSYMALYSCQQEAMIPDAEAYESPLNNFREMRPAELKQTLYGLVAEAVNTAETGGDTSRVFADLKQVLRGSPFIGDAVNIVKLAESNRPDRHPLMMLYMDKITAVIDEDYEKAQEVKGRIDKLLL